MILIMLSILVGILIAIFLFIIFRKFFLWYWKINEVVELLKTQNSLLQELLKNNLKSIPKNVPQNMINPISTVDVTDSNKNQTKKCKSCLNRIGANIEICPLCGSTDFI